MDSKSLVFLGLISGPRQYRIPSFQRAYSWEREDRETLWLDILTQYEVLHGVWQLEEVDREQALERHSTHYLGTIVLSGPSSLGVPKSDIIDGQQKISTLLLAICALRDNWGRLSSSSNNESSIAKRRTLSNTYLINDGYIGNDRYRVLPLSTDEKVFRAIVDHDGSKKLDLNSLGLEPGDSTRMMQAYQFFRTEMGRKSVPDTNAQIRRFAHLFPLDPVIIEQALAHRLSVIAIETKNTDDTNAIFESLNAKGRPLTQLDLLRNYVFMSLGGKADQVLRDQWLPVEKTHLPDRREMESFVWADVVSRGRNVLQKRTYRTVQSDLRGADNTALAAEHYVHQLNRRAPTFAQIVDPQKVSDKALRDRLQRLSLAGGKTARPLVLWVMEEQYAGRCLAPEALKCIAHIESFLVRRFLCALAPNNLNSMFGQMLVKLNPDESDGEPAGTVEARLLSSLLSVAKEWPDDAALATGMEQKNFYENGDSSQRIHVLKNLDLSYDYDLQPGYDFSDKSIEHILPQSTTDQWSFDLVALGQDLAVVQDKWVHTLGNLTMVAPSDNSKLGNKRFVQKLLIYQTLGYKMTKAVADFGVTVNGEAMWGAEQIAARATELTQRAAQIWPRPVTMTPKPVEPKVEFDAQIEDVVAFTSSIPEAETDE